MVTLVADGPHIQVHRTAVARVRQIFYNSLLHNILFQTSDHLLHRSLQIRRCLHAMGVQRAIAIRQSVLVTGVLCLISRVIFTL